MKKLFWTVTMLGLPLLTGCAGMQAQRAANQHTANLHAPEAQTYPHSYQQSLQASEHWRSVAADLSREVKQALSAARQEQRRVYVQPPAGTSDFSRAFHAFLVDNLLKEGIKVGTDAKTGLPLAYDLQMIKYTPGRKASLAKAEGEGRYLADVPNAEVILSSQIVEHGLYLMQETGIYYINEQDSKLYEMLLLPEPLPTRSLAVKGCKPGSKEC